jgi:chemotaxis protein MotB
MRKLMLVLGMAAVVGCGGISKEQYGAKEAEAAKYKQEVAALESKAQSLEQQNATLQAQVSAAKSELETTTAKLMEQSGEYAKLKDRTIRLSERLLFKENSSKLSPESKHSLDAMADAIAQQKDKAVIVAGYTDDAEAGGKGAHVKRWQLSTTRALEVAKYLVGRGLDPALIGIAGFGEARPVAANDSLANRALNRRAEIALTPPTFDLGTVDVSPATLETK